MANTDQIIPKSAITGIVNTDKAITKLDQSTLEFITTIERLGVELKKGGVDFKALNTAQKQNATQTQKLTAIEKDQLAAEKALERQRKAGIKTIEKQTLKELQLDAAIKKEVKSEQDLIAKTNALVAVRRRLDTSTKSGIKEHKKLTAEINKNTNALKKQDAAIGRSQRNVGNYSSAVKGFASNIAGALGLAGGIAGLVSLTKSVFNVRAEFEKFEAILTNSLGSKSKAMEALSLIKEFAASTPFSVQELTGSFVKLVNQGFIPTKKEMTSLGDLAASTGKTFDQLSEAIIDAQVGEFERLKEFGIRSQKEGDKVTFTFKGVKEQVDFTEASIQKYLLSLGKVEGVSGSMAAISETLGGKISNLGDAWDNLLNSMGESSSGVFSTVISWLSQLVTTIGMAFKSVDQIKKGVADSQLAENIKQDRKEVEKFSQSLQEKGVEAAEANTRAINLMILQYIRLKEVAEDPAAVQGQIDALRAMLTEEEKIIDKKVKLTEKEIKAAKKLAAEKLAVRVKGVIEEQKLEEDFLTDLEKDQDDFFDWIDKKLEGETSTVEKELDKQLDLKAKAREKEIEAKIKADDDETKRAEELADLKRQLVDETIESGFSIYQSTLDRESMALQEQREAQLTAAGEDKEKQAKINAEFDKKEAAVKTKKAKAEKVQAMISIAINTARAIGSSIATYPLPAGLPFVLLNAALGAVQLAAVAAKPIPKFFKGTDSAPDGLISVGERGRELIETKSGKRFMANNPTITSGLAGAKIYTNKETERIMRGSGYDSIDLREVVESNNRIEKAIRSQKQVTYDRANRTITERKGQYFKTYLNAKVGSW